MNKKAMKSNVWYLIPRQALKDKNLTMNDRNVLSVLVYLSQAFGNKFFRQRSKLLEDIKDSEFELSDKQVTRCLVKLQHYGYIKYKAGFHNNLNGKGCASEFELCYDVDSQPEQRNNVYPNTNQIGDKECLDLYQSVDYQGEIQNNVHPNTNTNTNTNSNSNISTNNKTFFSFNNKTKKITYTISTSKGVDVLTHLLTKCKDELQVYEYLGDHPTQSNFDKVEQYWAGDETRLAELHNFKRNLHYTAAI